MFYLINLLYVVNLVVIKVSIVFLYLRIFEDQGFRRICWATQILISVLFTAFALLLALRCSPISATWERPGTNPNARCVNYNAVVVSGAAVNIATDVWILLLPIRQLLSLSMDWPKKIQVMLMFNIGLL
jgi:high-affinity K+ transport system ATPase subunit B